MRPSCGSRRSAMFSFAISFRREMIAAFSSRGGGSWLNSTPSMRKRTRNSFSNGSMWMSLARFSTRVGDHGVDQPDDRRLARHVAQVLEIVAGASSSSPSTVARAPTRRSAGRWRRESPARRASTRAHLQPARTPASPRPSRNRAGRPWRSVSIDSSSAIGNARHCRRKRCDSPSISGADGGGPSIDTSGTPSWSESAASTSRCGDEPHVDQDLADLVAALVLHFERALQVFGCRSCRARCRISPSRR